MQVQFAAEPSAGDVDGIARHPDPDPAPGLDPGLEVAPAPDSVALRHELRTNLVVVGVSLGLSVTVAVGLSLLMTLLG